MLSEPDRTELRPLVRYVAGEPRTPPAEGIALCLSGGGFRASLFHLGSLWRLNEVGMLPQISRFSSVSGGSITSALLGVSWDELRFDATTGVSPHFSELVAQPLMTFTRRVVDYRAIARGLVTGLVGYGVSRQLALEYRRVLGTATLASLPEAPEFYVNASNLQTGGLWVFNRAYSGDLLVGRVERPDTLLADAVAASSAFPPFLSPMRLRFDPTTLTPPADKTDTCVPPFTTRVRLSDGGVYDNLGITTSWKKYRTILVSDAGGRPRAVARPPSNWPQLAWRAIQLTMAAGTEARKTGALDAYEVGDRDGAYWGIGSDMARYLVEGALPCPLPATSRLAALGTQLRPFDAVDDRRLVNWGYAITDAALRKHVDPKLPAPAAFPFPEAGVGA